MAVDFNSTPTNTSTTQESDTPMFAPIPSWERNRKRRGFGGGKTRAAATVAPETRSFETDADVGDLRRTRPGRTASTVVVEEPNDALMSRPIAPIRRSNSAGPLAIAAGVIVLGGLGAAGWYASHPRDTGVAQLTPGQATTTTTTTVAPTQMAANALPPAVPATTASNMPAAVEPPAPPTVTVSHRTTAVPARHATVRSTVRSRSVEDAGVNTSATLPAAPMPYTGTAVNPSAAAATPAPMVTTPVVPPAPVAAAPATVAPAIPNATTAAPPEPATAATPPAAPAAGPTTPQ